MKSLTNHLATPIAFHTADNHRVANFYDLDRLGLDDQFKDVVQNQLKSVAALMEDSELTKRGESFHLNRTVTLKDYTARSGHRYGSQGCRLADNQPFENEPTNAFGTGFLVGPRYLMTAGHCIGEQNGSCRVDFNKIYKIKVVFGYLMKDANDHEREFPASHVYTIKKVVGFFQTQLGHSNYSDWALVKLDRQVEGRTPLELDPIPVSDQDTYTIGHPLGTPAKLSLGERVKDIVGKNCFSVSHDVFPGNSGGPTFDRSTKKVIGITVLSYKNVFEKINVNGEDRAIFHILTSEESALRYDEAQKIVPLIERINICKNKVGLKVIGTCQHLARATTREGFGDFLLDFLLTVMNYSKSVGTAMDRSRIYQN